MKKTIKRLLALAMALSLCLAALPMNAGAGTAYTSIGGSTTITKNLVVDSDANIPDITFTYTIAQGTSVPATASTVEILASSAGATIGNAVFTNADTAGAHPGLPTDTTGSTTAGKKYAQEEVTVTFPDNSFTKPGVYRYVINEVDGGKPGVTYDTTHRYLDVFVVADPETNALGVNSCVLRDAATAIGTGGAYTENPGVKSSGFTNTITQCDFTFSKAIAGNQGDKSKRFTFTLNISNAIPGVYPIEATDVTEAPTSITVGTGGTYSGTFNLTDGSSLKVLGLNKDAICTVSEDAQDYTATHIVDTGSSVSGNNSGTITLADADRSVAFTNTRTGIIPTGVLLTVTPFAVGLMLFGSLAFFLMGRNRRVY